MSVTWNFERIKQHRTNFLILQYIKDLFNKERGPNMAGHVFDYYEMKPNLQGSKTEANLKKHMKGKAVIKMKATLFQYPIRNDARHLSARLGEYAVNSYVHAAQMHQVLWGPYTDDLKNLSAIKAMEHEHAKHTFPEYAKVARDEGFEEIASAFEAIDRKSVV